MLTHSIDLGSPGSAGSGAHPVALPSLTLEPISQHPTRGRPPLHTTRYNHMLGAKGENPGQVNQVSSTKLEDNNNNNGINGGTTSFRRRTESGFKDENDEEIDVVVDDADSMDLDEEELNETELDELEEEMEDIEEIEDEDDEEDEKVLLGEARIKVEPKFKIKGKRDDDEDIDVEN